MYYLMCAVKTVVLKTRNTYIFILDNIANI